MFMGIFMSLSQVLQTDLNGHRIDINAIAQERGKLMKGIYLNIILKFSTVIYWFPRILQT